MSQFALLPSVNSEAEAAVAGPREVDPKVIIVKILHFGKITLFNREIKSKSIEIKRILIKVGVSRKFRKKCNF